MPFHLPDSPVFGDNTERRRLRHRKSRVRHSSRVRTAARQGAYVTLRGGSGDSIYYHQFEGGRVSFRGLPPLGGTHTLGGMLHPTDSEPIAAAISPDFIAVSPAEILEQLDSVSRQPAYAWMFLVGGGINALLLAQIHLSLFFLLMTASVLATFAAHRKDRERRTFYLRYDLDKESEERFILLNQSLAALARAEHMEQTAPGKPSPGQRPAAVDQGLPGSMAARFVPYCLNLGDQQLFFFPDRLYALRNRDHTAIDYRDLLAVSGRNTEDGVVELRSSTGLNLRLHVRPASVAPEFASLFKAFRVFQTPPHPEKPRQEFRQERPRRSEPPSEPPPVKPATRPASARCHYVLGLSADCTREEAASKYRQLVKAHHPDRVSHMAPEFQQLATRKMRDITQAYDELKRLNGW